MTRKTRTWIAGTVFTVGSVAGMALATAGLMPTVDIELAVPAREAREYRPGSVAATGAEDEIVLVYLEFVVVRLVESTRGIARSEGREGPRRGACPERRNALFRSGNRSGRGRLTRLGASSQRGHVR